MLRLDPGLDLTEPAEAACDPGGARPAASPSSAQVSEEDHACPRVPVRLGVGLTVRSRKATRSRRSPPGRWAQKEKKRPGALGLTIWPLRSSSGLPASPAFVSRLDRMIVATALAYGARLLTADARMLAYPTVATLDYGSPG